MPRSCSRSWTSRPTAGPRSSCVGAPGASSTCATCSWSTSMVGQHARSAFRSRTRPTRAGLRTDGGSPSLATGTGHVPQIHLVRAGSGGHGVAGGRHAAPARRGSHRPRPRQLTREAHGVSGFAWSPDGSRIAFWGWSGPARFVEGQTPRGQRPTVRRIRQASFRWNDVGFLDHWTQLAVVGLQRGAVRGAPDARRLRCRRAGLGCRRAIDRLHRGDRTRSRPLPGLPRLSGRRGRLARRDRPATRRGPRAGRRRGGHGDALP